MLVCPDFIPPFRRASSLSIACVFVVAVVSRGEKRERN
jgi:hypothetical protein